ncbi:MAG: hypothetical protein BGN97_03545 [Microbacterium sp. 69-10]|uniref:hypothetical protein n=1 Tax=Microbacterium sp. 69-10 TaxID=1895783 RepID=UPI000959F883|nr:hypothetical protein [Microbacterium sp. 69-10]OJU41792.1 MAG: hypothetical protein BGN97_03545 [Microbacterium sp. 69-10]
MIDQATGEVRPTSEAWADLRARAEAHKLTAPETPEAIDAELRQIEALGFEVSDFLRVVLDEQYDAEKLYSALKNKAIAKHSGARRPIAEVRALAEVDAADAYGDWLNKKAVVKHVEALLGALRSKHIGLQSSLRGVQAMIGRAHRAGP